MTGSAETPAVPTSAEVSSQAHAVPTVGASVDPLIDPTDKSVLAYLRKKGMGTAAVELSRILQQLGSGATASPSSSTKQPRDEKPIDTGKILLDDDERKNILQRCAGGGYGSDRDAAAPVALWGVPDRIVEVSPPTSIPKEDLERQMGIDEARSLLDGFTSFQVWVLSLPEHDGVQTGTARPVTTAQKLIHGKDMTSASVLGRLTKAVGDGTKSSIDSKKHGGALFHLPPSAKSELLAVGFALLVHTYCELLEVGMESTAHVLRDTFRSIYEPIYSKEYADLFECRTTEDMMRLNGHNAQHMDALANLKGITVQVLSFQSKLDELGQPLSSDMDSIAEMARQNKAQEYERSIAVLQQRYNELSQRASVAFLKMNEVPFLRRARAVRWHLSLSTATYGLLASFLNAHMTSVLAMSTLLQTKCELHIERRHPLPFTPACVFEDIVVDEGTLQLNNTPIDWATPTIRRQIEHASNQMLPFPKFHLRGDCVSSEAEQENKQVEFNRALLVNGFRRLEAIERKHEYEVLPKMKIAKEDYYQQASSRETANPLEPTVLMSTFSASDVEGPTSSVSTSRTNTAAIWEETGIGLCCAKACPPDGGQVAVGCDDASVRIWNVMTDRKGEATRVLGGHKNSFPVFDVSWNRDGSALLSAGGDGSVRLWNAKATAMSRATASVRSSSGNKKPKGVTTNALAAELEGMNVSGLRMDNGDNAGGAALAVYRGHDSSLPIWSVTFAPCGYYFASAGADATARVWTTDRSVPVRLLTGHASKVVSCVDWHPNCNYLITGAEDNTARLWDAHSGCTVRVLSGCSAGINAVKISPCGRFGAGADLCGTVHIWDMGSGKKVKELGEKGEKGGSMIHAMSFSACGSSLATGGDGCCVKVWDVRQDALMSDLPAKTFDTQQCLIMDLHFTKRNLLLSVCKHATRVSSPVVTSD